MKCHQINDQNLLWSSIHNEEYINLNRISVFASKKESLENYKWWKASKLSCNFRLRCEVNCNNLLINTCSTVTISNCSGRTLVSPGRQEAKPKEPNEITWTLNPGTLNYSTPNTNTTNPGTLNPGTPNHGHLTLGHNYDPKKSQYMPVVSFKNCGCL